MLGSWHRLQAEVPAKESAPMQITLDTGSPLTTTDHQILSLLLSGSGGAETPPDAVRPSETPPEPDETPSGPDPVLLGEAIKRATDLIKDKQGAKVRAALKGAGVGKVTDLTDDQSLSAFLAELPE